MGIHRAEQSVEIDAPPEACFAALADYESFPEWQAAVDSATVLDRHPDGLARDVRFAIDAKVREVGYTLRYSYERPLRVWWEYVEGDVAHVEGEYELEPLAGGARTRATYRLGIDPGLPLPGMVARRLTAGVMGRSVRDLKDEAERRA